jgi:large subunit ribosomal protein L30
MASEGLSVTQVRSAIGTKPKHRGTLRALGLGRIGRTNVLPDRPEIRGMIARVPHLVEVRAVDRPSEATPAAVPEPAAPEPAAPEPAAPEPAAPEPAAPEPAAPDDGTTTGGGA